MATMQVFLPLFFLISTLTSTLSSPIFHGDSGDDNTTEFIRTSCGATQYPVLCFEALSGYANTIQQSPVQLALVATNVTFAQVQILSTRVSMLCKNAPFAAAGNKREAVALHDCASTLNDAADLTRQSADELSGLYAAVGPEVAWRVSNAQTWMSAALTNEDTCDDGFDGVGPSLVKVDVCGRVRLAKKFTSNALALVNILVASY